MGIEADVNLSERLTNLGWPVALPLVILGLRAVSALMDLYSATNGTNWTLKTNWLSGDPCANMWIGVFCTGGLITSLYGSRSFHQYAIYFIVRTMNLTSSPPT